MFAPTMNISSTSTNQPLPLCVVGRSTRKRAATGYCKAKGIVCRDFDIVFQKLGPMLGTFDREIALAADETGVPAPFLKSQLLHETGIGTTNFRYELSTVDFKNITGDQPGKSVLDPYVRPYVTTGTQDQVTPKTPYMSGFADAQANRNQFQLPAFNGTLRLFKTMPPNYNNSSR